MDGSWNTIHLLLKSVGFGAGLCNETEEIELVIIKSHTTISFLSFKLQ